MQHSLAWSSQSGCMAQCSCAGVFYSLCALYFIHIHIYCLQSSQRRRNKNLTREQSRRSQTHLFYLDVEFALDLSSSEDLHPAWEMSIFNPIACLHQDTKHEFHLAPFSPVIDGWHFRSPENIPVQRRCDVKHIKWADINGTKCYFFPQIQLSMLWAVITVTAGNAPGLLGTLKAPWNGKVNQAAYVTLF